MIQYTRDMTKINAGQLTGFFAGWPNPPSPETHKRILEQSDYAVVAVDDTTDMVVGFITAISDKVLASYIPLLEVLPEYQKRGIGKQLVIAMLELLKDHYMIDLICMEDLQPFYTKYGMGKANGMVIRNFDKQHGAL